jgi:flagellar export protein FliJ
MNLKSILNLKEWKEDEAKNLLAALIRDLVDEEKRFIAFEEQYNFLAAQRFNGKFNDGESTNIDEIKKLNEYLENLLIKIHRQKKVIADKEKQVEDARKHVIEASKEKKIFKRLDEKHKTVLKIDKNRKEQTLTDEHAGTGHQRKKGT